MCFAHCAGCWGGKDDQGRIPTLEQQTGGERHFHPSIYSFLLKSGTSYKWAVDTAGAGKPPALASGNRYVASTQDLHGSIKKEIRDMILPRCLGCAPLRKKFPDTTVVHRTFLYSPPGLQTEGRIHTPMGIMERKCRSFTGK